MQGDARVLLLYLIWILSGSFRSHKISFILHHFNKSSCSLKTVCRFVCSACLCYPHTALFFFLFTTTVNSKVILDFLYYNMRPNYSRQQLLFVRARVEPFFPRDCLGAMKKKIYMVFRRHAIYKGGGGGEDSRACTFILVSTARGRVVVNNLSDTNTLAKSPFLLVWNYLNSSLNAREHA